MRALSTLRTEWKLTAVPGWPALDVRLTIDTTAPAVVEAIEKAAEDAEIQLKRVEK